MYDRQEEGMLRIHGVKHNSQMEGMSERRKETFRVKYNGAEHPMEVPEFRKKQLKSFHEKWGYEYDSPMQVPEINQRQKQTVYNEHGVYNVSQIPGVQDKVLATNKEKFGDIHAMRLKEYQDKAKETNKRKIKREYATQKDIPFEVLEKLQNVEYLILEHHTNKLTLAEISNKLNVCTKTITNYFRLHNIEVKTYFQSVAEKQIEAWLIEQNVNYVSRTKKIIKGELDFYLPDHNIAIEYNGLYWHSDANQKNNMYHHNKWKQCNDKDICLISIFENEWVEKKDIVLNELSKILDLNNYHNDNSLHANQCYIVDISQEEKSEFFEKYHILGDVSSILNIGLKYENELVACMSFNKENDEWILARYSANKQITNGFGHLLNYFEETHEYSKITTYTDLRWESNNDLLNQGFKIDTEIMPNWYWTKYQYLYSKYDFDSISDDEMRSQGYNKIYDCGYQKFIKN
jgi:hypothetical protein